MSTDSRIRKDKARIVQLSQVITAIVPIGLGFLKIYTHYYSIFRSGLLDYLIAVGATVGGFLVLTRKVSFVISLICVSFLSFEVLKATVNNPDCLKHTNSPSISL